VFKHTNSAFSFKIKLALPNALLLQQFRHGMAQIEVVCRESSGLVHFETSRSVEQHASSSINNSPSSKLEQRSRALLNCCSNCATNPSQDTTSTEAVLSSNNQDKKEEKDQLNNNNGDATN
jgi:hypothetical protein